MQIEAIDHDRRVGTFHFEGVEGQTDLARWEHPELPDGTRDEMQLVSHPIATESGQHSATLSIMGDARSQAAFLAIKGYSPALGQMYRGRVTAAGGVWHLDDYGKLPPIAMPPGSPDASPRAEAPELEHPRRRRIASPPGDPAGDGGR